MSTTDTYHFQVGAFQCVAINDGTSIGPVEDAVKGVPPEEWKQALLEGGYSTTEAVLNYNCLYVRADQHHVLVDTGLGQDLGHRDEALMARYQIRLPRIERDGSLLDHLQREGIAPGDIDLIVLTHGDGDHIGGIADAAGHLLFPNARYVLSKELWDFWSNEALVARLPELLTAAGRKTMPLIRDRLQVVEAGVEFLPGWQLIPAPGHRPGHTAVWIASRGESLLHLADAAGHPVLMEHPSWQWYIDSDHDLAEKDKMRLLSRAAAQQALVFGSHLPFPGVGCITPQGEGWHWRPLA